MIIQKILKLNTSLLQDKNIFFPNTYNRNKKIYKTFQGKTKLLTAKTNLICIYTFLVPFSLNKLKSPTTKRNA